MTGVDLSVYRFDYDLTFAALLMHPDGTIYHTLGGRDASNAMSQLSMPSFVRVLRETLEDHRAYSKSPKPPTLAKRVTAEDWKRKAKNRGTPDCFHCHMVYDWQREAAKRKRTWKTRHAFRWPDPVQVGLELEDQNRVASVMAGSPAAKAGLKKGDVVVGAGPHKVRTFGDISRALEETPDKATGFDMKWMRGKDADAATLKLGKDWRVPTARAFAWRNSMWGMSPQPGFGMRPPTNAQLAASGLPARKWAMRVQYLVTWGPNAYLGRNAHKAGLRKGDIIYSIDGKSDFDTKNDLHFQSWFRFNHKPGDKVKIELIRRGKRIKITLPVVK